MSRDSDSLKAQLCDYAEVDDVVPHAMAMAPGDLWAHPYRGCVCGVGSQTDYYAHTVPIGTRLFCAERGLPEEAVDLVLRLVAANFNGELDELESVACGLVT